MASQQDIELLIEKSDDCYQEINFYCFASKLSQFASWTDNHGELQQFFSNANENSCECGRNKSCVTIGNLYHSCNCDHGDPVQRQDTIQISDKVSNKEYKSISKIF